MPTTGGVDVVEADWVEPADVAERSVGTDGDLLVTIESDPVEPAAYFVRARGTDGRIRWTVPLDGASPLGRNAGRKVIFSGNHVIVPTRSAAGGQVLLGLERATGAEEWSLEGSGRRGSGRVVDGGAAGVVWLDGDGVTGIDPEEPTRTWSVEPTDAERSFSEVRIVGDVALVSAQESTLAVSLADGERLWELDEVVLDATTGPVGTAVTVAAVGGSSDGLRLRWMDLGTGDQRWTASSELGPTNFVGIATDGDLTLLSVGRTTEAYRLGGGTARLWSSTAAVTFGGNSSAPLAVDGLVAVAGSGSRLGGPQGGYIEVYDADDGSLRRQAFTDAEPEVLLDSRDGQVLTALAAVPARAGTAAVPARLVALPLFEPEAVDPPAEEPESVLLGIPTPGEALTPKNVAFAAGLLALLGVLVLIPTTLFNSALEIVLHESHERWKRWSQPRTGGELPIWARPAGLVLYLTASAFLYSWLQPGWGINWATLISGVAFLVTLAFTTALSLAVTVDGLRRRPEGASGHPVVEFRTLIIAALCVAGSRLIGFVPGYLYGIVARYEADAEPSEAQHAAIIRRTSVAVLAAAVGAWFLVGPLRGAAEGHHPLAGLPAAVAAGLFMGGVESLMIGLLPFELLPGSTLRKHHRQSWRALWCAGGFLTALVLFRPGLVNAQSRSALLTIAAALVYAGGAIAFWWITRSVHGAGRASDVPRVPEEWDESPEDTPTGRPGG